jgi:hydrogenase expression/formation protein HypC
VVALPAPDVARIDLGGVRKDISLALVEDVRVGDYVIVHVGYALTKLDPDEAERTLAMMAEAGLLDAAGGACDDPHTPRGGAIRALGRPGGATAQSAASIVLAPGAEEADA